MHCRDRTETKPVYRSRDIKHLYDCFGGLTTVGQGCFQGETSETIVSLSQGHVSVMLFRADHAEKERGEGGEKGKEGGERKRERRERENCLILFGVGGKVGHERTFCPAHSPCGHLWDWGETSQDGARWIGHVEIL